MKTIKIALAGIGLALATAPAVASAQPWHGAPGINARQANLEQRINMGVRNGSLTRSEAVRLRTELRQIAALEYRYRRTGGLSFAEVRDLNRRFDRLSAKIRFERNDRQFAHRR